MAGTQSLAPRPSLWPWDPTTSYARAMTSAGAPGATGEDPRWGPLWAAADAGYAPAQYALGRQLLELVARGEPRGAVESRFRLVPAGTSPAAETAEGRRLVALAARRLPVAAGWMALYRSPIPSPTDARPAALVSRGLAALARPEPERGEALALLVRAAKTGDAAARYWLSAMLLGQEARAPGPAEAEAGRQALGTAAEAGHLEAMTALGEMLLANNDATAGVAWLARAAEAGDPWAFYRLGCVYHRGVDANWEPARSLLWLKKAAEAGNLHAAAAVQKLAPIAPQGADPTGWLAYAEYVSTLDSPGALGFLASCFETGQGGVTPEPATAQSYWLQAARGGEPRALARLLQAYQGLWGRAERSTEAFEEALALYELLSERGVPGVQDALLARFSDAASARLELATRFDFGRGGARDPARAARGYWQVAEDGDAPDVARVLACLRLGKLLSTDPEARRPVQEAARAAGVEVPFAWDLLRAGAERVVEVACRPFRFWDESAPTPALAVAIAQTAHAVRSLAEGANHEAAFQLAYLTWRGLGVPQDFVYADTAIAGAVRLGHASATCLRALIGFDQASHARHAHEQLGGADPSALERKANQRLVAAAEVVEGLFAAGPLAPTAALDMPWRAAFERIQVRAHAPTAPRLYVAATDDGTRARIGVDGHPTTNQDPPAPDLVATLPTTVSLPAQTTELLDRLGLARTSRVRDHVELLVAAAMGQQGAAERLEAHTLTLAAEELAAAQTLATAWWCWREAQGDFAEVALAEAWRVARALD